MNSSHKPFLLQSRLMACDQARVPAAGGWAQEVPEIERSTAAFAPLGLRTLWVRGASRRFGSAQHPQFRYETVYEMSS